MRTLMIQKLSIGLLGLVILPFTAQAMHHKNLPVKKRHLAGIIGNAMSAPAQPKDPRTHPSPERQDISDNSPAKEPKKKKHTAQPSNSQQVVQNGAQAGFVEGNISSHDMQLAVRELSKNYDSEESLDWRYPTGLERDTTGATFMHWACLYAQEGCIQGLLGLPGVKEALNTAVNNQGETFLHFAAVGGNLQVVHLLLKEGALCDVKNANGQTPLFCAAMEGHKKVVARLAQAGADLAHQDIDGATPLHYAAYYGHTAVVAYLLKKKVACNDVSSVGTTALLNACAQGHLDIVKLLLAPGRKSVALVNKANADGISPLHNACAGNHLAIAFYLMEKGANIHATTIDGISVLNNACKIETVALALELIKRGVDIHHRTRWDETPLHFACRNNVIPLVEALVGAGAVTSIKNDDGHTPADLATEPAIRELLSFSPLDAPKKEKKGSLTIRLRLTSLLPGAGSPGRKNQRNVIDLTNGEEPVIRREDVVDIDLVYTSETDERPNKRVSTTKNGL